LEHVFKMEELFKQLEEDKKRLEELRSQNKTGE
jgi:ribosomal protein L29